MTSPAIELAFSTLVTLLARVQQAAQQPLFETAARLGASMMSTDEETMGFYPDALAIASRSITVRPDFRGRILGGLPQRGTYVRRETNSRALREPRLASLEAAI
jgi:hypothetical protein